MDDNVAQVLFVLLALELPLEGAISRLTFLQTFENGSVLLDNSLYLSLTRHNIEALGCLCPLLIAHCVCRAQIMCFLHYLGHLFKQQAVLPLYALIPLFGHLLFFKVALWFVAPMCRGFIVNVAFGALELFLVFVKAAPIDCRCHNWIL